MAHFGIWNNMRKEFQFGIDEPTPEKARKKLFKKIGYASYKWRFEVRDIEKENEKFNRYKNKFLRRKKVMSELIKTGKVRFSYCNVFEPRAMDDQDPRYSVTLLIPKEDKETIAKINAGIAEATKEGNAKVFGTTVAKPKIPIYDGDGLRASGETFGEECKGHYVLTANSTQQPGIVDARCERIMNKDEFYSGCYGRATIRFFAYNKNGNKGIGCGLGNLQKLEDGEPLSGRTRAEDDFADSKQDFGIANEVDPITGQPIASGILGL